MEYALFQEIYWISQCTCIYINIINRSLCLSVCQNRFNTVTAKNTKLKRTKIDFRLDGYTISKTDCITLTKLKFWVFYPHQLTLVMRNNRLAKTSWNWSHRKLTCSFKGCLQHPFGLYPVSMLFGFTFQFHAKIDFSRDSILIPGTHIWSINVLNFFLYFIKCIALPILVTISTFYIFTTRISSIWSSHQTVFYLEISLPEFRK